MSNIAKTVLRELYVNKWVALVLLIVAGLLLAGGCKNNKKKIKNLPLLETNAYTNVQFFTRSVTFLNGDDVLRYIHLSSDLKFNHTQQFLGHDIPIYPGWPIGVLDDQSGFYVGTNKELLQFEQTETLVRSIPIEEFDIGTGKHVLRSKIALSDDTLWTTVWSTVPNDNTPVPKYAQVMQWKVTTAPHERKMSFRFNPNMSWAVDKKNQRVFIPKDGVVEYSFADMSEKLVCNEYYSFVDFDPNYGLLLSHAYPNKNGWIVRKDLETGNKQKICKGERAQWGTNGWVYFCRGSNQLWRVKFSDNLEQPVYLHSRTINRNSGIPGVLTFNKDKSLLSFFYRDEKSFRKEEWGLVLIDLKNKEWKELDRSLINTASAAWLESGDFLRSPSQTEYEARSSSGKDLLHDAVSLGDLQKVQNLLEKGYDINAENEYGYTVLYFATVLEKPDVVKFLIAKGADVNAISSGHGVTALHSTIGWQNLIMEILLEHGANPNIPDAEELTPFHHLIRMNRGKEVKMMLNHGADVNFPDGDGLNAIELAKSCGFTDIVKLLENNEKK